MDLETTTNLIKLFDPQGEDILLSYKGYADKEMLGMLARSLNHVVEDKAMQKKLFRVFIELAGSIIDYGTFINAHNKNHYAFQLKKQNNKYIAEIATKIKTADNNSLDVQIDHINQLSVDELRDYKRELLSKKTNDTKNIIIGFVKAALTGNSKIEFSRIVQAKHEILVVARMCLLSLTSKTE